MTRGTAAHSAARSAMRLSRPRRYALVGAGGRAQFFIEPIATRYRGSAAIVALCDPNPARLEHYNQRLTRDWGAPLPANYKPDQFERMLRDTRPDAVIIATRDDLHADYCVRTMACGCDVIVEKPLAIDAAGCNAVIDAARRTGRRVAVTFNCRYMPWAGLLKRLLASGVIGQVINVQMEWMLDARKGVSYFSRWHAEKDKSGGLMVHKATHHLDLVNWWLDAVPQTVFAFGRRAFFGAENKPIHQIGPTGEFYAEGDHHGDPFAPADVPRNRLDLRGFPHDGYRGDRSVWRDHHISIEDTMSVLVRYATGTTLTYSLNAYLPRRGSSVIFNGTHGRLELHDEPGGQVITRDAARIPPAPPNAKPAAWRSRCIVHPMFAPAYEVDIPTAEGGHDGADPLITQQLFDVDCPADDLHRVAGAEQGAASAVIGIAANQCFETGLPVDAADLVPTLRGVCRLHELA